MNDGGASLLYNTRIYQSEAVCITQGSTKVKLFVAIDVWLSTALLLCSMQYWEKFNNC